MPTVVGGAGRAVFEKENSVVDVDESADLESDLVDVAGIDLEQLAGLPDTVLTVSLRRILSDAEETSDLYAIFKNAIG